MAYSSVIKEQVINELRSGVSAGQLSRKYQVSIPTIYNWKAKYLNTDEMLRKMKETEVVEPEQIQEIETESKGKEVVKSEQKQEITVESEEEPASVKDNSLVEQKSSNIGTSKNQNDVPFSLPEYLKEIAKIRKAGHLEKALQMCNHERYAQNRNLLLQKVIIYTLLGKRDHASEYYVEAYKICLCMLGDETFDIQREKIEKEYLILTGEHIEDTPSFSGQEDASKIADIIITIQEFTNNGQLEEALNLCNTTIYKEHLTVLKQKASILYTLGIRQRNLEYLKEALSIYKILQLDDYIDKTKKQISDLSHGLKSEEIAQRRTEETNVNPKEYKFKITILLTKIYVDFVTIEEIEKENINEWDKTILKIAYYEKHKQKENALSLIKKMKKKYADSPSCLKILNSFLERIKIKRNCIFDTVPYGTELGVNVDFTYAKKLEQMKQEKIEEEERLRQLEKSSVISFPVLSPSKISNLEVPKSPIMNPKQKIVVSKGTPVTARYQQLVTAEPPKAKSEENIENRIAKEPNLRIRDVFENEVLEIGGQLCLQISSDKRHSVAESMDALDRFENLINKSASDEGALCRMINLIDRINSQEPGFIKTNDKRNDRLLEEVKQKQKLKK